MGIMHHYLGKCDLTRSTLVEEKFSAAQFLYNWSHTVRCLPDYFLVSRKTVASRKILVERKTKKIK